MDISISRFAPEATGTPDEPRPSRWPSWWWSRLELSPNTHRSFGHTAPLMRGWLHLAMVVVWPVLATRLVLGADGAAEVVGTVAFGLAMQAMFSASALTHWKRWDVWTTEVLFRFDQVGIFLAIAGSITAFALLALDGWAQALVLIVSWLGTLSGISTALWPGRTPFGFGLTSFLAIGAVVVPFVPTAWARVGGAGIALLGIGALVYTAGAIALGVQWPDLKPDVFGYHEVWHTLVVVGVLTHYVMIERYFLPLA